MKQRKKDNKNLKKVEDATKELKAIESKKSRI